MSDLNKQTHFERFGLAENFDIDLDLLEEKYLHFQQLFHPDKLAHKSKEEQINLEHNSILITESYDILKDSLKRAIYLLKLKGINIDDDNCPINPSPATLILVMEFREELLEAQDIERIDEIRDGIKDDLKQLMKQVKVIFATKNYQLAAEKLIEAKYLDKILIDIKAQKQKIKNG
ncbi:MAG: Fe-S protein assembly co-chaperone HscB [Proteobacteria bacterium]|nr:Fe-S protein assembly co-chaperone HscB [Pseudomonadota bacterium]